MTSEIVFFHRYWNNASLTPRCPLNSCFQQEENKCYLKLKRTFYDHDCFVMYEIRQAWCKDLKTVRLIGGFLRMN